MKNDLPVNLSTHNNTTIQCTTKQTIFLPVIFVSIKCYVNPDCEGDVPGFWPEWGMNLGLESSSSLTTLHIMRTRKLNASAVRVERYLLQGPAQTQQQSLHSCAVLLHQSKWQRFQPGQWIVVTGQAEWHRPLLSGKS